MSDLPVLQHKTSPEKNLNYQLPLKVLVWPNKVLTMKSEAVDSAYDLTPLTDIMFETMKTYGGVGLSAIQLGVPLKVITTWEPSSGKRVWVNAEFEPLSTETHMVSEGCLSLPGFYEKVERYVKIGVTHLNAKEKADGYLEAEECDGYLAHILQHEIDHTYGEMFTDHLKAADKSRALGHAINFKKSMSRKKYA